MLKWLQHLVLSVLILTTPVLGMSQAMAAATTPVTEVSEKQFDAFDIVPSISYDQIIDFLEALDEGEFDYVDNPEDVESVIEWITYLATRGARFVDDVDWIGLEKDSYELLSQDDLYSPHLCAAPSPQLLYLGAYNEYEIEMCKSWISKKIHQVKKYVKKHKKALIVGAAIVVAAVVVVVTRGAALSALGEAGSTAVAGEVAVANEKNNRDKDKKEQLSELDPVPLIPSPTVAAAVDSQIEAFRETKEDANPMVAANNSPTIVETCRDCAKSIVNTVAETWNYTESKILHDLTNNVLGTVGIVPGAINEAKGLLSVDTDEGGAHLIDKYQEMKQQVHESVDQLHSTGLADNYTKETTPAFGSFSDCFIPLPSGAARVKPTQVRPVKGWKVGDPINNQTSFGRTPKWNSVRMRYWKNEAHLNSSKYTDKNINRMKRGLAPQRFNEESRVWESMELHHAPPQRDGGLFDVIKVWPDEHAELDQFRNIGK